MRPRFGTLNTLHQDDLPQVDRPNVLTRFFGVVTPATGQPTDRSSAR
jgi:hypothetical protein